MRSEVDVPAVDVIIPAYNAEAFILETLDSVAASTGVRVRAIVTDDGSTDQTAARVEQWAAAHDMPTILLRRPNGGIAMARNEAINEASAPWIAFLDADDRFRPTHLHDVIEGLIRHPECVVGFDDASNFTHGSEPEQVSLTMQLSRNLFGIRQTSGQLPGVSILSPEDCFVSLERGNWTAPSTWVMSRAMLPRVGYYRPMCRFSEDRDWLQRATMAGPLLYLGRIGVDKRRHFANATRTRNDENFARYGLRISQALIPEVVDRPLERRVLVDGINRRVANLWYVASVQGIESLRAAHDFTTRLGLTHRPGMRDWLRAARASWRAR